MVGYHGSGTVSYSEALAAVFVESWIFIFISLVGLRGRLIELVPKHIMLATAVGEVDGTPCWQQSVLSGGR